MEEETAKKAAHEAVNPDRLLDGEDPDTTHLDDAEHWLAVYRDLLKSKQELIGVTEHRIEHVEPDAAKELGQTDLAILQKEGARFRRRIAFWEERLAHLSSARRE